MRAKTEKIGNLFSLTWLIFAGLVTYEILNSSHRGANTVEKDASEVLQTLPWGV